MGAGIFAALAVSFWVATTPSAGASPVGARRVIEAEEGDGSTSQCTICHKRRQTLTLTCNSLDYRRHIDHGDTIGACNVTPVQNP